MAANSLYISIKHKCVTRAHPDNWKMMAKIFFFSTLCIDWLPLHASTPLPSAAWPPYFKYLPPTLQPDHFKSHGNSSDVRGEAKHVTVYTHTCGVNVTIMHVWGGCMCGQAVEALTWGLREHRFESHQQTPRRVFFMVSLPMKISTSMLCAQFCLHHVILQCM